MPLSNLCHTKWCRFSHNVMFGEFLLMGGLFWQCLSDHNRAQIRRTELGQSQLALAQIQMQLAHGQIELAHKQMDSTKTKIQPPNTQIKLPMTQMELALAQLKLAEDRLNTPSNRYPEVTWWDQPWYKYPTSRFLCICLEKITMFWPAAIGTMTLRCAPSWTGALYFDCLGENQVSFHLKCPFGLLLVMKVKSLFSLRQRVDIWTECWSWNGEDYNILAGSHGNHDPKVRLDRDLAFRFPGADFSDGLDSSVISSTFR